MNADKHQRKHQNIKGCTYLFYGAPDPEGGKKICTRQHLHSYRWKVTQVTRSSLLHMWMEPYKLKFPLLAWGNWGDEQQGQRIRRNGELHYKKWVIDNHQFDQKYTYLWCQICWYACKRNQLQFWYLPSQIYTRTHHCAFVYYILQT